MKKEPKRSTVIEYAIDMLATEVQEDGFTYALANPVLFRALRKHFKAIPSVLVIKKFHDWRSDIIFLVQRNSTWGRFLKNQRRAIEKNRKPFQLPPRWRMKFHKLENCSAFMKVYQEIAPILGFYFDEIEAKTPDSWKREVPYESI